MRSNGFRTIILQLAVIIAGFAAIVLLSGFMDRNRPELPADYEDSELSMNGYASAQAPDWQRLDGTSRLKPYRIWARYKTARFEARVGLQRINFGSATLLRPLMWFDSVDRCRGRGGLG